MPDRSSQVARRNRGRRQSRPSAIATAIANSQVLNRFWEFGANTIPYLQQCLSPRLPQPEPADHAMFSEDGDANLQPAVSIPQDIVDKMEQCKKTQKQIEDLVQWMDNKRQPTEELVTRMTAAIERLQSRMWFNRRYEGPDEIYNELGQRLEDLQHCLDAVDRDAEEDIATIQSLEDGLRTDSSELLEMLGAWLQETYGISLPVSLPPVPDFQAPFDLQIIDDAEAACEYREAEDEVEENELKNLPLQPEGHIMNRRWVIWRANDNIKRTRRDLEDASEKVQKLQGIKYAREAGEEVYDDDAPEGCDIDGMIGDAEAAVRYLADDLGESIDVGRQLGIDVTSNGSILDIPLPPAKPKGSECSDYAWGAEIPDEERDLTEEEEAAMIAEVTAMIEPWLDEVDDTMSIDEIEQMPPLAGTPTSEIPEEWTNWEARPGKELTEPTPADSVSQPDHHRIDLGYSIYRNELDRLRDMQEAARAELPQDAIPDMDSQPGCE